MPTMLRLRNPVLGQVEELYVDFFIESLGSGKIATEITRTYSNI